MLPAVLENIQTNRRCRWDSNLGVGSRGCKHAWGHLHGANLTDGFAERGWGNWGRFQVLAQCSLETVGWLGESH